MTAVLAFVLGMFVGGLLLLAGTASLMIEATRSPRTIDTTCR